MALEAETLSATLTFESTVENVHRIVVMYQSVIGYAPSSPHLIITS